MAFFDTLVNTFGGRWFDQKWQPQTRHPAWHDAVKFYVNLLRNYGPPGASSNGFNENLALFTTGHCAMWIDATVGAPASSPTKDEPGGRQGRGSRRRRSPRCRTASHWFWAWALAIPKTSTKVAVAKSFLQWATSEDYIELVGETNGWTGGAARHAASPPMTTPQYLDAAPFAKAGRERHPDRRPGQPTAQPVPYTGIQYVAIPEFQAIGTTVGQLIGGGADRADHAWMMR